MRHPRKGDAFLGIHKLCFDYLQLKDMFGLDLETEMVQDEMDLANEVS